MRTAELAGADLDAWVARAEGRQHIAILLLDVSDSPQPEFACFADGRRFDPSTNPALGQPIMEREQIGAVWGSRPDVCSALVPGRAAGRGSLVEGPTMLIAGMRARVAQVYGDVVGRAPTGRPCPWTDPHGASLLEGDTIQHPDGLRAVVAFDPRRDGPAQWRAVYDGGESLFLGHQIAGRGQACKVQPGIQIVNPMSGQSRHPPRKSKKP